MYNLYYFILYNSLRGIMYMFYIYITVHIMKTLLRYHVLYKIGKTLLA